MTGHRMDKPCSDCVNGFCDMNCGHALRESLSTANKSAWDSIRAAQKIASGHAKLTSELIAATTLPPLPVGEDEKLPELNVNGQFTNSELRTIDKFVADVDELIVDRKGLLTFIHKQRQEVLFRERQLLAALKENAHKDQRIRQSVEENRRLLEQYSALLKRHAEDQSSLTAAEKEVAKRDDEIGQLRILLIASGRNVGAHLDDAVSMQFLRHIPEEVRLAIARREGEIERLKELMEEIQDEAYDRVDIDDEGRPNWAMKVQDRIQKSLSSTGEATK